METNGKVALFIDLENSKCLDLERIITEAGELGKIEEARAYADFSQGHLQKIAIELYAKGVMMIHAPSWRNGGESVKRSDDRLLEGDVRNVLSKQPCIGTYVLATADADIIPTCQFIRREQKRLILYSSLEGTGWILKLCGWELLTT